LKEVSLSTELELLESYLELEKIRFENQFDYTIHVDSGIDKNLTKVPSMITQPLVENAVIHGLANKRTQGLIELGYQLQGDVLIITVKDNGVGFFHSKRGPDPHHTSIGIRNTQKRLKLIDQENDMEVSEQYDDAGGVSGTKVVQYIHLKSRKS
jgi:sensor histidine kinase YesM